MAVLARHLLLRRCCTAAALKSASPSPAARRLVTPTPTPTLPRRAITTMSSAAGGDGSKAAQPVDALALFTGPGADHLRGQSCSIHGCSAETPPVPPNELPTFLAALPAWRLSADGATLSRTFVARNFLAALSFFNRVGEVAEQEGHHPDLHLTDYRNVRVVVATHAGGARVTMADLVLAAKLDALPVEYSPKWLMEQQEGGKGK